MGVPSFCISRAKLPSWLARSSTASRTDAKSLARNGDFHQRGSASASFPAALAWLTSAVTANDSSIKSLPEVFPPDWNAARIASSDLFHGRAEEFVGPRGGRVPL